MNCTVGDGVSVCEGFLNAACGDISEDLSDNHNRKLSNNLLHCLKAGLS